MTTAAEYHIAVSLKKLKSRIIMSNSLCTVIIRETKSHFSPRYKCGK